MVIRIQLYELPAMSTFWKSRCAVQEAGNHQEADVLIRQ
jgi:hypothetical protein